MAKTRKRDDDDGEILTNAARPAASGKMTKARVRSGQTLVVGETDDDGNFVERAFRGGAEVEVSEEDVQARPWLFEPAAERRRAGQNTRLQQRVEQLQSEIDRLKEENKALANRKAGKADPLRESAVESILARGDNYGGRGEPTLGSVPSDVADAFERGVDLEVLRGGVSLDDETGFKGSGREGAAGDNPSVSMLGAKPSIPSNPEQNESVRPGSSEPSDKPKS